MILMYNNSFLATCTRNYITFVMRFAKRSSTGHGLWTLDWTMDWTLDSIMDSTIALDFRSSVGQGSKATQRQSYDVLGAVNLKDSSSVRCRIIEETTIFVETVT